MAGISITGHSMNLDSNDRRAVEAVGRRLMLVTRQRSALAGGQLQLSRGTNWRLVVRQLHRLRVVALVRVTQDDRFIR